MGIVLGLCLGAGFWTGATRYCCNRNPYRPIVGSPHRKSTKQKEKCLVIYFILKSVTGKLSHRKKPCAFRPTAFFYSLVVCDLHQRPQRVAMQGRGSIPRSSAGKFTFLNAMMVYPDSPAGAKHRHYDVHRGVFLLVSYNYDIMKIFLICSKVFYSKIPPIKEVLEQAGHEITLPNAYDDPGTEARYREMGEKEHAEWKAGMLKHSETVIKGIDAVLVLNFEKNGQENYIGGATFLEMYDAFRLGKKIYVYNDVPSGMLKDEIQGFEPFLLHQDLERLTN